VELFYDCQVHATFRYASERNELHFSLKQGLVTAKSKANLEHMFSLVSRCFVAAKKTAPPLREFKAFSGLFQNICRFALRIGEALPIYYQQSLVPATCAESEKRRPIDCGQRKPCRQHIPVCTHYCLDSVRAWRSALRSSPAWT
jgi:hypothetical protein